MYSGDALKSGGVDLVVAFFADRKTGERRSQAVDRYGRSEEVESD